MVEPARASKRPSRLDAGKERVTAGKARAERLRVRAEATTAGQVQRRVGELEIINQGTILSALAMVLVVPALVSLVAVMPVGSNHGLAASWLHHLSLSPAAQADVRSLFRSNQTVHTGTTAFSAFFTIVSAYAWPAALQRVYVRMWGLSTRGLRDLWRPILWLPSLFVLIAAVAASGSITSGVRGALLTGVVGFPLVLAWTWWTQHLLLSGRVSWRALRAGAVATAIGLIGFSVFNTLYLSGAIVYNSGRYGPLGVVFVLMTWLTAFSLVMLGGALVGHTVWLRAQPADDGATSPTAG